MAQATLAGRQTLRDRFAVIFAVIAILPLLLFSFVLVQHQLIPGYSTALTLGLSVAMAILGFVWLRQTGTQISSLADYVRDVRRMEPGDLQELEPHEAHQDLAELARIARSFDTLLAELKATIQVNDQLHTSHRHELEFLDVIANLTSEIDLGALLQNVMGEATRLLHADRSTLFLHDDKTRELFSRVLQGDDISEIRFPNYQGIAGTVFTTGETIISSDAYADPRFNPAIDEQTGYATQSLLCAPVVNKRGTIIGVTEVLNKRVGVFTDEDASRLKAFTAQIAISLENAKLFDHCQTMNTYTQNMLESMSSGVITVDANGIIITCNTAGLRILRVTPEQVLRGRATNYFTGSQAWILEKIQRVEESQAAESFMDAEFEFGEEKVSVNVTILPLVRTVTKKLGCMIMVENIRQQRG